MIENTKTNLRLKKRFSKKTNRHENLDEVPSLKFGMLIKVIGVLNERAGNASDRRQTERMETVESSRHLLLSSDEGFLDLLHQMANQCLS